MSQKTAIVAITKNGTELGQRLMQLVPGSNLYVPTKFVFEQKAGVHSFRQPVKKMVREVFGRYDSLVLVMAVGTAVRLVASELKSKHEDPAVVAMDEKGKYVVSLLSGHVGGANELARRVASLVGAEPVVTTASEVGETLALDLLGQEFGWRLDDMSNVNFASAAVVNGEEVGVYQDAGEQNWWKKTKPLPDNIHIFFSLGALEESVCSAALIITDRLLSEEWQSLLKRAVIYRPKSLVVGIGCNRGVSCSRIEKAVTQVFLEHGLSTKSMRNVATIDLKRDEQGLLDFAQEHSIPVEFFSKETLMQVEFPSNPSRVAYNSVGVQAVCEPAALRSSKHASLVVPKTKLRDITIAVARVSYKNE